jgi:hypothetical protein
MMNCRKATRLLSEAQDRELSLPERAALRLHLMLCSGCRHFGMQIPTLRQIARAYAKGKGHSGGN